jgi:hypothetical protein
VSGIVPLQPTDDDDYIMETETSEPQVVAAEVTMEDLTPGASMVNFMDDALCEEICFGGATEVQPMPLPESTCKPSTASRGETREEVDPPHTSQAGRSAHQEGNVAAKEATAQVNVPHKQYSKLHYRQKVVSSISGGGETRETVHERSTSQEGNDETNQGPSSQGIEDVMEKEPIDMDIKTQLHDYIFTQIDFKKVPHNFTVPPGTDIQVSVVCQGSIMCLGRGTVPMYWPQQEQDEAEVSVVVERYKSLVEKAIGTTEASFQKPTCPTFRQLFWAIEIEHPPKGSWFLVCPNLRTDIVNSNSMLAGKKLNHYAQAEMTDAGDRHVHTNLVRVATRGYRVISPNTHKFLMCFVQNFMNTNEPVVDIMVTLFLMHINVMSWDRHHDPAKKYPMWGQAKALWQNAPNDYQHVLRHELKKDDNVLCTWLKEHTYYYVEQNHQIAAKKLATKRVFTITKGSDSSELATASKKTKNCASLCDSDVDVSVRPCVPSVDMLSEIRSLRTAVTNCCNGKGNMPLYVDKVAKMEVRVEVHEGAKGATLKAKVACPICKKKQSAFRSPTETWTVSNITRHFKLHYVNEKSLTSIDKLFASNKTNQNNSSALVNISDDEDGNLMTFSQLQKNNESTGKERAQESASSTVIDKIPETVNGAQIQTTVQGFSQGDKEEGRNLIPQ